ncbi:hypothetical protein F4779DRAFT_623523 [Xylariaceae sp. FL0662B]|nr:hypothetical protein F4779DRAFT_623523 [Xylariaceae sp. FL0662B]
MSKCFENRQILTGSASNSQTPPLASQRISAALAARSLDSKGKLTSQPRTDGSPHSLKSGLSNAIVSGPVSHTPLRRKEWLKQPFSQDAYVNAHVPFDVQSTVLSEPPKTACSHVVPPTLDPEVLKFERQRAALKGGENRIKGKSYEDKIGHLTRLIVSTKAQWKKLPGETSNSPIVPVWPRFSGTSPTACALEIHQRRIDAGTSMVNLGRLRKQMRPHVEGFLSTLDTGTAASLLGPRPDSASGFDGAPFLSSLPFSSSFYPSWHLRAPSPPLSDGSTLTESSVANLDYDPILFFPNVVLVALFVVTPSDAAGSDIFCRRLHLLRCLRIRPLAVSIDPGAPSYHGAFPVQKAAAGQPLHH